MKGRLGIRLWGILNKERPDSMNYQIAETILKNIFELADTSSNGLAKLCNVSKPSISRFCKELGYKDFYDFRLDAEKYTVSDHKISAYKNIKELGMLRAFCENCKNYIDSLEKNVNEVELMELARAIAEFQQVYIMGHLQSGGTAFNMQYNLFEVRKMTEAFSDISHQKEVFRQLSGRELIIIFSVSGKFFQDYFEQGVPDVPNGVKIYMITSNQEIPDMKGVKVIRCDTSGDIAACNLSLEIIANIIVLKYKNYVEMS